MRRIAIVLPALAALFQPLPALAYHVSAAGAWSSPVVTYDDQTHGAYRHALARAVAAFNASGMRLVLVPAAPGRAQITIRLQRHGSGGVACYGTAGVTTVRSGAAPTRARVRIAAGCRPVALFRLITAHELGHALGLAHEDRRCATMASSDRVGEHRCRGRWVTACRLLQVDDIRGLVRLYGGTVRSRSASRAACHDAAPPAAGSLAVRAAPDGAITAMAHGSGGRSIVVGRRLGTCPRSPLDPLAEVASAPAAATTLAFAAPDAAGRWCYRLWRLSNGGRASPPATVVAAA